VPRFEYWLCQRIGRLGKILTIGSLYNNVG